MQSVICISIGWSSPKILIGAPLHLALFFFSELKCGILDKFKTLNDSNILLWGWSVFKDQIGDFYTKEEKFTTTFAPMKAFWGSFSAPLSQTCTINLGGCINDLVLTKLNKKRTLWGERWRINRLNTPHLIWTKVNQRWHDPDWRETDRLMELLKLPYSDSLSSPY